MRFPIHLLIASLAASPVWAEEKPKLEPLPYIPPPPGMVDRELEPQVTITQKGEDKVEEFRIKGRLYMIKVTPPHGKSYYLIDTRGDGLMRRYDDLSPNFMVPMWVIHQF
ncbi:MAG: DUF2782 domain-containing protein [Thiobacillus sp.]|nr:DUF2782 domain-containing protein [Thiobacillus sp.]